MLELFQYILGSFKTFGGFTFLFFLSILGIKVILNGVKNIIEVIVNKTKNQTYTPKNKEEPTIEVGPDGIKYKV